MATEKTYSTFKNASIDWEILVIDYLNKDWEEKTINFYLVKTKDLETTKEIFENIIELLKGANGFAMYELGQLQELGIIVSSFDKKNELKEKIEKLAS